ncbi:MAG: DUF63 family protein [Nanoarchaeota archaeon]|nr:DUF63 family protein [Nanoarchaeota archaeon]
MNITEFFQEYFIKGWSRPESYNIFDTISYAGLAVILVYLSYLLLKKKINFTFKTALQIIPFIVLGSIVRVFADSGVYPRFFWTVTPGVWIIFFVTALACLYLDQRFKTRGEITVITPLLLLIPHLFYINIVNGSAIIYFTFFYLLSLAPFFLLRSKFALLKNNFNMLAIASHLFDATSSFVNVDFFNYVEIHVLGGFFAGVFDTGFVMYPLKLIILPILYLIDKEKDNNLKNYLKLVICVLGLGPGIRNLITVILGV